MVARPDSLDPVTLSPVARKPLLPPRPERVTPNSETRPEMPAVCPPLPVRFPSETDEELDGGRITQISIPPELDTSRDRVLLLRLDGVDGGQLVALTHFTATIGRELDNSLRINEGGISRHHARIAWEDDAHWVEDLASRNGTYVKGRRVNKAPLADGDLVQFGPHACFRYTVTDSLHEQLLRKLHESSTIDVLTGACNRRHFDARLKAELSYARRHNADLAVVMLDIDHFKRVNDTHGHLTGDAVIRHVAALTRGQLRAEDLAARYGGEELVVLLRGTDVRGAVRVAERIRATIEVLPARVDGTTVMVTVSGGCAALSEPNAAADGADLVARADTRLYEAKQRGRNRVVGSESS
ncbi:MAG: diguanylate cyclase [Myxococcales bacterium]|nr:diguanylate cyclase [Myxococcales bacterium]